MKSLLFHIPEAWKRYTFRVEPPRKGHHREYPPPGYDPSIGGSSCWMAGLELKLFILHSVNRLTQLASLKVLGSIDRYGQFLYVHVRHWQLVSIVIICTNQICQYWPTWLNLPIKLINEIPFPFSSANGVQASYSLWEVRENRTATYWLPPLQFSWSL